MEILHYPTGFSLSLFTKPKGLLTKRVYLNDTGDLVKDSTGCALTFGQYNRVGFQNLTEFNSFLDTLTFQQALAYGIASIEKGIVVSSKLLKDNPGAITRTRKNFTYVGPTLFMVDYDVPEGTTPINPEELRQLLIQAVPALEGVEMLWRASASSNIFNGAVNLTGITGQRIYFIVNDGRQIEKLGEIIEQRLWLLGYGHIQVSKSGALLTRTIVDTTVWQPERLDFVAGAKCQTPLRQEKIPGIIAPGEPVLNMALVPPLTKEENKQYAAAVDAAKREIKPEQSLVKDTYVKQRLEEWSSPNTEEAKRKSLETTLRTAVDHLFLTAEFLVETDNYGTVTIAEILGNKEKYHGETLPDPLEPDYGGGAGKAKLLLVGARPIINSFAHGGRIFQLRAQTRHIQLVSGASYTETTNAIIDALKIEPDIFCNNMGPVIVDMDVNHIPRIQKANWETLMLRTAASCRFYEVSTSQKGETKEIDKDPPRPVLTVLANRKDSFGLRHLKSVISAPTMRPDGTILQFPGYDESTRLLLMYNGSTPPTVPETPTPEEYQKALNFIYYPFSKFDFVEELDKGVMLAAILTAVVRRTLPTAPGFIFTATTAGSGKTKLAQCVDILAGGTGTPKSYVRDNDELRKSITSSLMNGTASMFYDNVTGLLRNDLLCALLSSPTYEDRILGVSETTRMETNCMFLFTGNNLEAAGDLSRRTLPVRIDPQVEKPWDRTFDIEPVSYVRKNRLALVAAALTILRYSKLYAPLVQKQTGSFEQWSNTVRSAVVFANCPDPADAIHQGYENDSELDTIKEIMVLWKECFRDSALTAAEIFKQLLHPVNEKFSDLHEVFGAMGQAHLTPVLLGNRLKKFKGRIVDGYRFVYIGGNTRTWQLVKR